MLGALPVLAYNQWAFGSPLDFAYANAVAVQGCQRPRVLGLNDDGFFGITAARGLGGARAAVRRRGLLTLTPVLAMAVAGAVAAARRAATAPRPT